MEILKWLLRTPTSKFDESTISRMCLNREEMNKWQMTDVVINVKNCPTITLTESKMQNIWYHDEIDCLFSLTNKGFKVIKGSKKVLFKHGFERIE